MRRRDRPRRPILRAPIERIRVLWLIKGLGAGGAERLVSARSPRQGPRGVRCRVAYLLPWKDALAPDLRADGVPVTCLHGGKEWDLRWAFRLRRLLRSHGIDVVHIHSPYVAGIARHRGSLDPPVGRPRIVYTEHLPWSGYVLPTRWLNALTYPLDDAHRRRLRRGPRLRLETARQAPADGGARHPARGVGNGPRIETRLGRSSGWSPMRS